MKPNIEVLLNRLKEQTGVPFTITEHSYDSKQDGRYEYYILEIWRPEEVGGSWGITSMLDETHMDAVLNALSMIYTSGVFK